MMRYLIIFRDFNLKWLLLPIGVAFFFASNAASRGELGRAEQDACYEKFAAAGFSEKQARESSDRTVLEICDSMPRYPVNSVWHINRDSPTGAAEKAAEILACGDALKFHSPELELDEASDEQLIRACGTVPAILD